MTREEVLKEIVPDQKEKDDAIEKYKEISKYIRENFDRETILVGSVAKDTFLKGDKDLDIFVFFDIWETREVMETEALNIGKSIFGYYKCPYQIEYAEHPYISGEIEEYSVEIVPCYRIDPGDKIISSVDRTPFHLLYVMEHLEEWQKNEVRLLKKFLKSQKLYGAESKVNGFSGYLCELLIIYYGSFDNLIKDTLGWGVGKTIEFIEPEKRFKDPLVVIDPVDPNRNVASPVSLDTLSRFVLESKIYADTDDEEMFRGPKRGYEPIRGGRLVTILIDMEVLEEIFYAQCRKFLNAIDKACRTEGFTIYRKGLFSRGIFLDFEIDNLPVTMKHYGPKIGNIKNISRFIEKNDSLFAEGGHIFSFRERRFNDVIDVIETLLDKKIGMGNYLKNANITVLFDKEANKALKNEIIYY